MKCGILLSGMNRLQVFEKIAEEDRLSIVKKKETEVTEQD
jgi:hypothetical protein